MVSTRSRRRRECCHNSHNKILNITHPRIFIPRVGMVRTTNISRYSLYTSHGKAHMLNSRGLADFGIRSQHIIQFNDYVGCPAVL